MPFFAPCFHGRNFSPVNFLCCVNDFTEPMVISTAWAKIYSAKYLCNARVGVLTKFLSSDNFLAVR